MSECLAETLPDALSNDDLDSEDILMTLIDTRTGRRQPLPVAVVQATTRVVEREPFSLPTHDAEGSRLAFLEDEFHACDFGSAGPGECDLDGDGLPFGHVLRVFDVDQPGVDLSPETPAGDAIAAQPDLNVNGTALAVSDGLVFFRAPASTTPRSLDSVVAPDGGTPSEPSVSASGDYLAFTSQVGAPQGEDPETIFFSETGHMVKLVLGPNGEFASDDGQGNSVYTYQLLGAEVFGNACTDGIDDLFLALPGPACGDLSVLGSTPAGALLPDGDPGTGFGVGDPTTDVFRLPTGLGCFGNDQVSITVEGPPRASVLAVAVGSGGVAETGVVIGPGCDARSAVYVQGPSDVTLASARTRVSCAEAPFPTNGDAGSGAVSADGNSVAYASDASDVLGSGADTNGVSDIFVFDAGLCTQTRVSVGPGGAEANGGSFRPAISAAGDKVVFESLATNLDTVSQPPGTLGVYLHDRTTGITQFIAAGETPDVSDPGDVAFAEGGNVEVSPAGPIGPGLAPSITADGRFLTFQTAGPDSDVFVVDLSDPSAAPYRAGVARVPLECRERLDPADFEPLGGLGEPRVSGDGRFLFYTSDAPNLIPDGSTVPTLHVEDRKTGAVAKLGVALDGTAPDAPVSGATVSEDGSVAAFTTEAGNLGAAGAAPKVLRSELGIASAGESVLGVYDPNAGFLTDFTSAAEFVKVANGVAVAIAEDGVRLFRRDCEGSVCTPVLEDLMRTPAFLSADALSISDRFACVVIEEGGVPVPACHEIGTPPSASLDDIAVGAPPECAEAVMIQVEGDVVVYTTPAGKLCQAQLDSEGPAQPVLCDGAHCSVGAAVLGPDRVVCFEVPESQVGDANGDGPDDSVLFVNDAANPDGEAVSCETVVERCALSVCDPRTAFTQEPVRTCKFLTPKPGVVPGPTPSVDDFLVVRCALGFDNVIARNEGDDLGEGTDPFGLTGSGEGDVTRRPACVDPERPAVSEGGCPCTDGQSERGLVCSDSLGLFLTDNTTDSDGDGLPDADEVCDFAFNPDVVDADEDGFPDACDGCVINGVLDPDEQCDPSVEGDPLAAFCTDDCQLTPPTSFTTESGYKVKLALGPNGEFARDDGQGNHIYRYIIIGPGLGNPFRCFVGPPTWWLPPVTRVMQALPNPTCSEPIEIRSAFPSSVLLPDGDPATGFGVGDPDTDVFRWRQAVACAGLANISITVEGMPPTTANAFALNVGNVAEQGLIAGPDCPVR